MNGLCHCVSQLGEIVGREHELHRRTIPICAKPKPVSKLVVLDEPHWCALKGADGNFGEHHVSGVLSQKRELPHHIFGWVALSIARIQ